jgi:hypothetical protein
VPDSVPEGGKLQEKSPESSFTVLRFSPSRRPSASRCRAQGHALEPTYGGSRARRFEQAARAAGLGGQAPHEIALQFGQRHRPGRHVLVAAVAAPLVGRGQRLPRVSFRRMSTLTLSASVPDDALATADNKPVAAAAAVPLRTRSASLRVRSSRSASAELDSAREPTGRMARRSTPRGRRCTRL